MDASLALTVSVAPDDALMNAARSGNIRTGHLSGDVHMHAVGLLTPELFELHDRSRLEVWAFCWTLESTQPVFQRQRQRILKAVDHHVRLAGVGDTTAARLIAQAMVRADPGSLNNMGLQKGGKPLSVLPGMTGSVEIRTGQRSVLAFVRQPMMKSQEAFTER